MDQEDAVGNAGCASRGGAPSECARREIARSRGTTRATRDGDGAVERPVVDAEAGYAAVEAAERVTQAMQAHRWEGLGSAKV